MTFKEEEYNIDGLTIRQISEHKYLVTSKTDTLKIYEIDLNNKDNPHPDCKGFEFRRTCSHWEAVIKLSQKQKEHDDFNPITKKPKTEDYYIKEIVKLICIMEQDSDNKDLTIHRDYVKEKLNMIINGSGIGIHPSLEHQTLKKFEQIKR